MDEQNKTLDEKVGFLGRVKYIAVPALATVGAYFAPEIKKKYESLPKDEQRKYANRALWLTEIASSAVLFTAGAKLYKNYIHECMEKKC